MSFAANLLLAGVYILGLYVPENAQWSLMTDVVIICVTTTQTVPNVATGKFLRPASEVGDDMHANQYVRLS